MTELTGQGELAHLTAERVWMETEKALNEPHPEIYFEMLHQVGALKVLFPEIAALDGVPNPAKYHPENLIALFIPCSYCSKPLNSLKILI